jgi:hypothetical protein
MIQLMIENGLGFLLLILSSINLAYLIAYGNRQNKIIFITIFFAAISVYLIRLAARTYYFISFI